MKRRSAIFSALGLTAGAVGWAIWPREGMWNPCLALPMPERLAKHEIVQSAWAGLDAKMVWDVHVHLAGFGDGTSRVWVNPLMQSVFHPFEFVHAQFYANAACATHQNAEVTDTYVERLDALQQQRPVGAKLLLLAMDYFHDALGNRVPEKTVFYVPNDYAADVVARHPERFEWAASVHPYRADCLEALEWAKQHGARAVKWIPSTMNIDPASRRCKPFYDALKRLDLPLISHGGYEHPLLGSGALQALNNPLALRRPLEHGVRVIVAHCASTGTSIDTDQGARGREVDCFSLFSRMMEEPQFVGLLFGDISALTESSRVGPLLRSILERSHWHGRLLNGSDYPLPGYLPEVSINRLVEYKFIPKKIGEVLREIREYDPLLFDFVVKRHISAGDHRFPASVFETAAFFRSRAIA